MSQVKLFSSSGGARVAKRSGRQKKQKVKKPLKTLAIWLLVILCLEGLYFFCIYTNNSFVKKWRTIYINTAMDTMRHQWLATYFIPKDVIDEVRYEYGLVKAGTVGKESTWGRTDPVPADQTPSTSYDSIVTLDPNVTHETDQPDAEELTQEELEKQAEENKALLEKAGHSIDEITDFASLKAVADDIHARAEELGFDAFSSAGLEGSSSWRFSGHLANMPLYYEFRDDGVTAQPATITGAYLENFKNIWDLYTTDSATTGAALATATGDESEAEFGEGKAAFYQNGTWEYSNLTGTFGMDPADLAMIPIYCGVDGEEKAGLCAGTENCWAINNESSEEDIQATIDFLVWVVTSDEGTTMLAQEFGPCPFKDAKDPENVFFQDANKYTAEGNYVVTWAFNWTPAVDDWRAAVVDALTQYTAGTGDWSAVETAFVQGWATQYAKENA